MLASPVGSAVKGGEDMIRGIKLAELRPPLESLTRKRHSVGRKQQVRYTGERPGKSRGCE